MTSPHQLFIRQLLNSGRTSTSRSLMSLSCNGCCRCNHARYTTPFFAHPTFIMEPGRNKGTSLYCFDIGLLPSVLEGPCANSSLLHKVEFWAGES